MKKIALLLLCPAFSYCQNAPLATVHGVVTYFFNEYQGDKPDIGSDVWLCETEKIPGFDFNLCDTFQQATIYRAFAASYSRMKQRPPENISRELKNWRGDDDAFYKVIDNKQWDQLLNLQVAGRNTHSTIDASGNYSFTVKPGIYYIYIKSNNRKNSDSNCEILGKVYCKQITVEAGQSIDISHKFDQY